MIIAIVSMAILGGILGLVLAIASKAFHVQVDPRIEKIQDALPGANCGACGYPGCSAYAEAIVLKGAPTHLCAPGAGGCIAAIAAIMGVEATSTEPEFATVRCDGNGVRPRFHYDGVRNCKAATVMGLAGSFQDCPYGCLGLGSCIEACPFGALFLNKERVVKVDEEKCTGCRKCVETCPRQLLRVDPESRTIFIRCNNRDKGAVANKMCNHACIACRKCEKECPFDAIHIEDNLAVIDYDKCKLCGKCVKACPKDLIVNLRAERRERKKARETVAAS